MSVFRVYTWPMDRDIVRALVKAVELKDQTTAAHTWRVALYTQAFVEDMGAGPDDVERYVTAAVLHDVGKIDIPQAILAKPGALDAREYEIIKTHTTLGHERLVRMGESDSIILNLVRSHHERIDGSGYPDGLLGEAIPEEARFFAVIDSFDAMTSIRAYRSEAAADAATAAMRDIREHVGVWYCDDVVGRFESLYDRGSFDWILRYFNDPAYYRDWAVLPDRRTLGETRSRFLTAPATLREPPEIVVTLPREVKVTR